MDLKDISLNQYGQSLSNFMASEEFVALDDTEKQRRVKNFRDTYIAGNDEVDPAEVDAVTEGTNKTFLRGTGRGRVVPVDFMQENNIIFPNQEKGYKELTNEQKLKKLEEFKLKVPDIAAQNPTQREDTEFYLNQSIRELERRANGEDVGWIADKGKRITEGFLSSLADYTGAVDASEAIKDYFHENPDMDPNFTSQLAQGLGSAASSIVIMAGLALTTKGLGGTAALANTVGTGGMLGGNTILRYNEAYKKAIDLGLDESQATDAAVAAMPAAVIDTMGDRIIAAKLMPKGVEKVFEVGSDAAKKAAFSTILKNETIKHKLLEYSVAAMGEGAEEAAGDYIAGYGPYLVTGEDDFIPTSEELRDSFVVGAVLGAGINAAIDTPGYVGDKRGKPTTTTNKAGEEVVTTPKYTTKTQRDVAEVQKNLEVIPASEQAPVYQLLAEGRYKEAYALSNKILAPEESPDAAPEETPEEVDEDEGEESPMTQFIKNKQTLTTQSNGEESTSKETSSEAKEQVLTPTPAAAQGTAAGENNINEVPPTVEYLTNLPEGGTYTDYENRVWTSRVDPVDNAVIMVANSEGSTIRLQPQDLVNKITKGLEIKATVPQQSAPAPAPVAETPPSATPATPEQQPEQHPFLQEIQDSLASTGELPVQHKNSFMELAWNRVKSKGNSVSNRANFLKVVASVKKNSRQGWRDALMDVYGEETSKTRKSTMTQKQKDEDDLRRAGGMPEDNKELTDAEKFFENADRGVAAEGYINNVIAQLEKRKLKANKIKKAEYDRNIAALRQMIEDIKTKNPTLRILELKLKGAGGYFAATNTIGINRLSVRTLGHEIGHALADADIAQYVDNRQFDPEGLPLTTYKEKLDAAFHSEDTPAYIKVLINAYYHAAKAMGNEKFIGHRANEDNIAYAPNVEAGEYGFTTLQEFVAETYGSESFQEKLSKIMYDGKTIWDHITEAIQAAFKWMQNIGGQNVIRATGENVLNASLASINQIVNSGVNAETENNINFLPEDSTTERGEMAFEKRRMLRLMGASMYNKPVAQVAIKELLQNSFDAVKAMMNSNEGKKANIIVSVDYDTRTIAVEDNGIGMTKDIVKKAFLTIGGTNKEGLGAGQSSGGLGLAKVQFLLSSEKIEVESVRDGVKTIINTTNEGLFNDDFDIITEKTNEPNGTKVSLTIPKTYETMEGETREIDFPGEWNKDIFDLDILSKPLLGDVNIGAIITKDGESQSIKLPLGKNTPQGSDNYVVRRLYDSSESGLKKGDILTEKDFDKYEITKSRYGSIGGKDGLELKRLTDTILYSKITFNWGTADLYVSETKKTDSKHQVLSSGLYQFDTSIQDSSYNRVPYDVVIDIKPSVKAESEQYPFNNQREDFKNTVSEDIKELKKFVVEYASGENAKALVDVFKSIKQLPKTDPQDNLAPEERAKIFGDFDSIKKSNRPIEKETARQVREYLVTQNEIIDQQDKSVVRDRKEKSFDSSFKADKKNKGLDAVVSDAGMDVNSPNYHNNTTFDYLTIDGAAQFFSDLGSVVLDLVRDASSWRGFKGLMPTEESKHFVGISIDKTYGGINVKKILNAIFINPLAFDPTSSEEAVGVNYHIALHEITHEVVRSEDADFTSQLANVYKNIYGSNKYGYYEGLFRSVYSRHFDTFKQLKQEYDKSTTRNISKSFEGGNIKASDSGSVQSDADSIQDGEQTRGGAEGDTTNNNGDRIGDVIVSNITKNSNKNNINYLPEDKVVYHGGSYQGVGSIKVSSRGALGAGIYFTPILDSAKKYAKENGWGEPVKNGKVTAFNLILKNPIKIQSKEGAHGALVQLGMTSEKASDLIDKVEEQHGYLGKEISSRGLKAGHDGIELYNGDTLLEAVIWNSNQAEFLTEINYLPTQEDEKILSDLESHPDKGANIDGSIGGSFEYKLLRASQALQRGYPEDYATIQSGLEKKAKGIADYITGLRGNIYEHIGDLYHRAGSPHLGSMVSKVKSNAIDMMGPYRMPLKDDVAQQSEGNALYQASRILGIKVKRDTISEIRSSDIYKDQLDKARSYNQIMDLSFAAMYSRLKAYTPLQAAGRNMAIAFGMGKFEVYNSLAKSIDSFFTKMQESGTDSDKFFTYGLNPNGVNNLKRTNNETKAQKEKNIEIYKKVLDSGDNGKSIAHAVSNQLRDEITGSELMHPIYMLDKLTNNINYRPVTPQENEEYLDAVSNNADNETLQTMVDRAFYFNGFDLTKYYRGDETYWIEGDRPIYLTLNRAIAKSFGESEVAPNEYSVGFMREFYIKGGLNILKVGDTVLGKKIKSSSYIINAGEIQYVDNKIFYPAGFSVDQLMKAGYHGIEGVMDGSTVHEIVIFDSRNVKSAAPVTYDLGGNPIGIAERANVEKNNINYLPDDSNIISGNFQQGINESNIKAGTQVTSKAPPADTVTKTGHIVGPNGNRVEFLDMPQSTDESVYDGYAFLDINTGEKMPLLDALYGIVSWAVGTSNKEMFDTIEFSKEELKRRSDKNKIVSFTKENNINYLPEEKPKNKKLKAQYKRLARIRAGNINDKQDHRTQEIIKLMSGIKNSDLTGLSDDLKDYFFELVDNVYNSRTMNVVEPDIRFDSDHVIAQIKLIKRAIDSNVIDKMISDYDSLIDFDEMNIDITDKEAVQNAINEYLKENKVMDLFAEQDRSEKANARMEKIYANWRKKFKEIRANVIEYYGTSKDYMEMTEDTEGEPIHDQTLRDFLQAHYEYVTSVNVNEMKGRQLYEHFFALNNISDGSYNGMKVTVNFLADSRDAAEKINSLKNSFRDPMVSKSKILQALDKYNRFAELHQVQLGRLSAYDSTRDWLQNKFLMGLYDGIVRTSNNRKVAYMNEYIASKKQFEASLGREMNTEDRVLIAIFGRLCQYAVGENPDKALARNIKKERKSINNIIEHGSIDNRKLFDTRIKGLFETAIKGLEGEGSMIQMMDEFEQRIGGTEGPKVGRERRKLLAKQQEIFSRFNTESKIISEGLHGQPFTQQYMYISNDVLTHSSEISGKDVKFTDPLAEWELHENKQGVKSKASHYMERSGDLGGTSYYSYNHENILNRNVERIAVDNGTIVERFIISRRLRKRSPLNNIIAQDENGVYHPERVDAILAMAIQLVKNATSRGEPLDYGVGVLRAVTSLYSKPVLSSFHHIITQPLAAMFDYGFRNKNMSGWLRAASYYASVGPDKVNEWFEKNQKWTAERLATEAMAIDQRRSPIDDTNEEFKNNPAIKHLQKYYEKAGDVMTFFMHRGDNFSAKVTILAEYERLLKEKFGTDIRFDERAFGTVEGRLLTQATLNAEKNINTSNKILRGELFTDRKWNQTVVRNLLFAFSAHQASLATQLNQAIRDLSELKSLGAPQAELASKVRTISGIVMQQLAFTTMRFYLGGLAASLMISAVKDFYDDDDGKIAELYVELEIARKKKDPVRIAHAENELNNAKTIRGLVTKFENSTQSPDSLFKQIIRDGTGSFHLVMNNGAAQKVLFFIPDAWAEAASKAGRDVVLKEYEMRIRVAKEKNNIKEAARLTEEHTVLAASEYIPLAFPNASGFGMTGLYGAVLDTYGRAIKEGNSAIMGAQEWSWNDFAISAATLGVGQSELTKTMNMFDKVEDEMWRNNKAFQDEKLPAAEERKKKPRKLTSPSSR